MSWLPTFKLGVLNAWIFIIPVLALHFINIRVFRHREAGGQSRIPDVLFLILHILPIFMPLKINKPWFYVGLVFYLVGMTLLSMALYSFATTPSDKLVTKGIFKYSRNPMYLGIGILFNGISMVSISWVYFLLVIFWGVLVHTIQIPIEESECIKRFGDEYKEYMKRTLKWLGVSK